MNRNEFLFLVRSDLCRHTGQTGLKPFLKAYLLIPGFKYAFWLRLTRFLHGRAILGHTLFHLSRLILTHYMYLYGISIPYNARIGSGLYIGHFCGIFVSPEAVIGKNCNLSQGVTVGKVDRGLCPGAPVVGNRVYFGPGAKVFGGIRIGNNVAIGANAVVTKDVPDNAVVTGIPAKIISSRGSTGYINKTGYERVPGTAPLAVAALHKDTDEA